MDKKTAICQHLKKYHTGGERAVYSHELQRLFSIDGRGLRRKINSLRQDGYPICSDERGYRLPNLIPPESPKVGKYGMLRHSYLRKHREGLYTGMLMEGTLNAHLEEVDREANRMLEQLTTQMALEQGVTEELKARDQMLWVQRMNNIRQAAEEIIYSQLIYA